MAVSESNLSTYEFSIKDFLDSCTDEDMIGIVISSKLVSQDQEPDLNHVSFSAKFLGFQANDFTKYIEGQLSSIYFSKDDIDFKTPRGISHDPNPREVLCEYARDATLYVAQQGIEAISGFWYKPGQKLHEIVAHYDPEGAAALPQINEPRILLL